MNTNKELIVLLLLFLYFSQSEILTALSRWMHLLNNNKQFCMEQNREKLFSVLVTSLQDTSQPTQIHDACGVLLPTVTEPMLVHISEYTSLLEQLLSPFLDGSITLNHLNKKVNFYKNLYLLN